MKHELEGIIPPLVSPFKEDETLDEEALRDNIRFMLKKKVHGICLGGSTGEGHTLSVEELARSIEIACEEIDGKIPVVAGIIANSTRDAIAAAKAVSKFDVAALQITPVHYVFKPTEDATYAHFERLTREVDIPVIIYNVVPWNYLSPQLLVRIMKGLPQVIGVKQSAGDLKLMADLMLSVPEGRRVFTAVDALLYPSFAIGSHGTIAANPAAVPGVCVTLWNAVKAGDHKLAREVHEALLAFWNTIFADNLPANVKYVLSKQGVQTGRPRMPMPPTSAEQAAAIDAELDNVLRFDQT
ncbi:MAG: dihydrodipicolinate synthase family protein [Salinicola sp.]|uniref:dihydrodipicolinate synthase family protein n=1 Tax=uncultured Salinicola sp. TaxID=1193542 RepID=UPI000C925591|nr:dihydrodipicolinate synthase family protein [uncultured Salinicola sp.]MAM58518.1 dihydrodipicolinate synthase family protein [Salinicola sp.]|tara:strand:+ start:266 stop:1159 length:894 start_codon:yes stop_codon:yes gene_type:complete